MADRNLPGKTPRRRFLLALGTGAVALASPQVSRAQTASWRVQSAWRAKDILFDFALDYAKKVNEMAGGRFRLDMLPAGAVVPAVQMQDAIHVGILEAGHGSSNQWYSKHRAFALFGAPPSFGWDAHGLLAWFYHGGGEALYRELVNDVLKLNLVGLLYFPMPTQPLGWFRKEITGPDSLSGLRYRTVALSADLFREMGAAIVALPAGDVVPAMDRGTLDGAEFNNPSSDLQLGFPDVAKVYVLGGHHRQAEAFELIFNKAKHDALPAELKAILRHAAFASSSDQLGLAYSRYARDLEEIRKRSVNVGRASEAVLNAQLAAWEKVIAQYAKEPFFAKVLASQKAWVKRVEPYLQTICLSTAERAAAFRRLIG